MDYPAGFFGSYHNQKPICGVLAVAIAANVTYDVANEACRRNMISHQQRHGGKTYDVQRRVSMAQLGCKVEDVELCGSLKTVIEALEEDVTYHITFAKHVITVRNGNIVDQGFNGHYLTYPKVASRRVKSVIAGLHKRKGPARSKSRVKGRSANTNL